MKRKKNGNPFRDVDCENPYRDTAFTQTYHSQLMHPAYQTLSDGAKTLLMICKDCRRYSIAGKQGEFYPNAPKNDPLCFYMNRALLRMYGGGWSSPNKFRRCMTELIIHGFVTVVETGWTSRTKSIYRFSGAWMKLQEGETIDPVGASLQFIQGRKK